MQIWAESGKSALPICNYSQILYQFLTFTQNLKRSHDSLKISRSTSTNVYPCEINAKVDADVFDNAWLPLYSGTWLMTTTVNSGGTMTLTWN